MATITTDLICNLNQPVAATFLHGNLFSQDNAGNTINVHVMDNGEPATIGGTVSANVIRADGNTVAVSGSLSGNQCSVVLPQACYAVPGRVEIIIKLTQSTTITTIAAIVANVYRSTTDTVVDPGTIIPSIQALIEEIEDAVDSIPVDYSGLLATIAANYSSSKTYQVGQYAWQGGVLKRCIVPITTAETYTAAHWTNAVIGDDLSALKSAINKVVCENLMGNEASVLYPVNIPAGGYFTVSTSDGSVFPTDSTLKVQLLKENKTQTDYFGLKNGAASRTIHTSTSQPETRYLRFNQTPTVPLMVNMGQSALPYQQYFPDIQKNVEQNTEDIEEINETVAGLLEGEKIVDILAVQNSVKVSRPRIINGSLSTTTGKRDYTLSQVNSYCITPDLLHVAKGSVITKSAQTTMRIYEYSKDDAFISYSTVATGTTKYTFSADKYVRLFFLVSGSSMNAKTIFDNVVFDLILLNYEKPDIISTFMGLSGNGGTFEQYVESGEACIIQFPNSEVMEIDFHKDALSNNYQYYRDSLALRGVRRIDYIVITHYHDDHVGLFAKALEYGYINIDGAKAYLPQYITNELAEARGWETYKERQDTIIQTLQEHDCTIVYPVDGDVLKIDDAVITWYNCDHSIYSDTTGDYYSTNYNDWSLCFNFRYENTIVNYSSDLGPIGQRAMAGKMPKASILKAMHHGWDNGKNALVPAFINNVSPDMVVSCNGYEHRPTVDNQQEPNMLNASSPIYSWAEANGVPAYPTCTNGNIDILINKYGYRLDGHYTRFIRNGKNWSWSDNSEHVEP